MTSPARAFAVLNLFSHERPVWAADEINEALGYTRATGYRYVKDLVEAGLLQKVSAGRYALGPRIIELDYQFRRSDPLLLAAAPVMDRIVRDTGLDAVLTAMFGMKVIDIHRTSGDALLELGFGRGRPRPLFRGAAPKVIMACLPRARLQRLHADFADEIAACGLGASWPEFRAALADIRRQSFYLSRGELDPGIGAAAVPLSGPEHDVAAALALVGRIERLDGLGNEALRAALHAARQDISERLDARIGPTSALPETERRLLR